MAVWMRLRGSFSRHRPMRRDTSPGTSERRSSTGPGRSFKMDDMSAGDESPRNGLSPVAISYSMMPSEKRSVR